MTTTPAAHDPSAGAEELPPLPSAPLGRYRHYKGGVYDVVGVARNSETLEPMVVRSDQLPDAFTRPPRGSNALSSGEGVVSHAHGLVRVTSHDGTIG